MHKDVIAHFPNRPGIYKFTASNGEVMYVGKALSLKDRVASYFANDSSERTRQMVAQASGLDYIETGSEFEALLLESRLIKQHKPKYNVTLKDDKSYLYIFISTSEEFPKIILSRKPKSFVLEAGSARATLDGLRGEYFGPFPSAATTRSVLKLLRRIFPYCQQKKLSKRRCFYSHLGLCNPCPSLIDKLPESERSAMKKKYRRNIFNIKKILDGNLGELKVSLEKERDELSRNEQFEDAQEVHRQLTKLEYIAAGRDTTSSFLENENFHFDRQKLATENLRSVLKPYFPSLVPLERIECYDISNFQGKEAVGAQVVFVNGIAEKSFYRKYKIKSVSGPNDPGMMAEVLKRRLAHAEWPAPNLIVVDGGKSQVGTIVKTLMGLDITIPVIGLAKRLEHIVLFNKGAFIEISLKRRDAALKLLQQLRDETHRFVITYHKKRRSKSFLGANL